MLVICAVTFSLKWLNISFQMESDKSNELIYPFTRDMRNTCYYQLHQIPNHRATSLRCGPVVQSFAAAVPK